MKITYPGHANVLCEGKLNFMCDPWLVGEHVNNGTVWFYPPRRMGVEDLPPLDFIYISHDHSDHCNEATVKALPKNIPYYIMDFSHHHVVINRLKKWGVENINVLQPRVRHEIESDTFITIIPSDMGYRDSAAIIEHDGKTLLHVNDCVLNEDSLTEIGQEHSVDIAFLPYAGFSGYPGMYEFDEAVKNALAEEKKLSEANKFFSACSAVKPRYAVPSAGDLVILKEGYEWLNYFDRASPDDILAMSASKNISTTILSMKPGDSFDFSTGFMPHADRDEWGYNAADQSRYAIAENIHEQIKAYEDWLLSIEISDFENTVFKYFEKGLDVFSEAAAKVGEYIFSIRCTGPHKTSITIDFSKKIVTNGFNEKYTKKMELDGRVLMRIINHDILWGDAYSSCHIVVDRRPPNNYNTDFWKWLYDLDSL